MLKLSSLRADTVKETDGDWLDLPDFPGVRVRVRSIHYPAFAVARDLASQKLTRKYGRKPVPPEILAEVNGELVADHLLLEWEGLDEPYNNKIARDTLTDPAFRNFLAAIQVAATEVGRAEIEFVADARGNSAPPSAGN